MGKNVNLPPYVKAFRDRYGKMRFYLRAPGRKSVALPNPAEGKAQFAAAYTKAMAGGQIREVASGTLDALITEYLGSSDFREKKPATQYAYRNAIEHLRSRPSIAMPVSQITRPKLERMRDEIAENHPGKANMVMNVLKLLLDFGTRREGYNEANPALKIRQVKGGEYRSWTDAELQQFEAHWPRGFLPRLIYELALGTGQRRGDIAKMTWADIRDGEIYVCQEKTGERLWIPLHRSLSDELAKTEKQHAVLVSTVTGRAYSSTYLGASFAEAIRKAALPNECVLHGLRKAAARRLAEAGATSHQIMAITGHKSLAMVEHYTKEADQRTNARQAMGKVVRMDRKRKRHE
jgi:integrase